MDQLLRINTTGDHDALELRIPSDLDGKDYQSLLNELFVSRYPDNLSEIIKADQRETFEKIRNEIVNTIDNTLVENLYLSNSSFTKEYDLKDIPTFVDKPLGRFTVGVSDLFVDATEPFQIMTGKRTFFDWFAGIYMNRDAHKKTAKKTSLIALAFIVGGALIGGTVAYIGHVQKQGRQAVLDAVSALPARVEQLKSEAFLDKDDEVFDDLAYQATTALARGDYIQAEEALKDLDWNAAELKRRWKEVVKGGTIRTYNDIPAHWFLNVHRIDRDTGDKIEAPIDDWETDKVEKDWMYEYGVGITQDTYRRVAAERVGPVYRIFAEKDIGYLSRNKINENVEISEYNGKLKTIPSRKLEW